MVMSTERLAYWQHRRNQYSSKPADSKKLAASKRICLRCRKPFKSSWIGNRRCHRCLQIEDNGMDI